MGTKRKIEIEKRDTNQQRSVTCNKRRKTVFSKAADLCRHSGANIAVFVTSPAENSDVVYSFSGYSSASEIADCYLNGKLPPKIVNPQSKLGFLWESDPDLYHSCDDLSELNLIEDRLERMKSDLLACLEKKQKLQFVSDFDQNPSIFSIDEIGSQFVSDDLDQNPNSSSRSSSQFASFGQNPNSSFLDEIYDGSSSQVDQNPSSSVEVIQGASSSSDQPCCFENDGLWETKEENNNEQISTLTQESQTEPMVNVGGYDDQSFWDNLYNDDVFGLNSDFPLDNPQANTINEEDDYMIDIGEFLNEEEIELLHFNQPVHSLNRSCMW